MTFLFFFSFAGQKIGVVSPTASRGGPLVILGISNLLIDLIVRPSNVCHYNVGLLSTCNQMIHFIVSGRIFCKEKLFVLLLAFSIYRCPQRFSLILGSSLVLV